MDAFKLASNDSLSIFLGFIIAQVMHMEHDTGHTGSRDSIYNRADHVKPWTKSMRALRKDSRLVA